MNIDRMGHEYKDSVLLQLDIEENGVLDDGSDDDDSFHTCC